MESALLVGATTYCEAGVGALMTQPLNTVSNVAYVFAAYFSYRLVAMHDVKHFSVRLLPVLLLLLGMGSLLWHAFPNQLTWWADTIPLALFLLVSFFWLFDAILPSRKLVVASLFALLLLSILPVVGFLPSFNGLMPYALVFVTGASITLFLPKALRTHQQQFTIVLAIFAAALIFRTIDLTWCPFFSGGTHFLWHILNGVAVYLLVRLLVRIS